MDAVKFLEERARMCGKLYCYECPLYRHNKQDNTMECNILSADNVAQSVAVVEKWSKEHPRKTRQSEFLKQWPNAKMNPFTGTIDVPPCYLDKSFLDECREHTSGCHDCRRKYWLKEVE
nr:MAG TPA: hypothetical protein [Caudoviricetes sp.]